LNILIGPNGSGKTCLLSALKFLRDFFRVGAAQALALQGGARRAFHHGESEMSFSITQNYGYRTFHRQKISSEFHWAVVISQAGQEELPTITSEVLSIIGEPNTNRARLFEVTITRTGEQTTTELFLAPSSEFGADLFSRWISKYGRVSKAMMGAEFRAHLSTQLSSLELLPDRSCFPLLAPFDSVIGDTYERFQLLNEYNIVPDTARASTEQLPFAQMAPNGAAVSEVIHALENKRFHKLLMRPIESDDIFGHDNPYWWTFSSRGTAQKYADALDNINRELSAAVKPITRVSVEVDPTNGKRFVVFYFGTEKFYAQEVSDGTVKWLCILVSLFVPISKVYLLEEPENFLHPWMQQRLIEIMRGQAKKNRTVFLLSSHSATILNSARPEEILIVRHSDEGTHVSAIDDLVSIREVLSQSDFHLGDLWVSGAIGGVPTDDGHNSRR